MPKMNVAFSLDAGELKRFDDWRHLHDPPLTRGAALVVLLDCWERNEEARKPPVNQGDPSDYPY